MGRGQGSQALLREGLLRGPVIPAMPLALEADGRFSPRHQRALVRYQHAAGAQGFAVGVHSTQFAIRDPAIGLYRPVLELVSRELDRLGSDAVRIAGVVGPTTQALAEAQLARELGYDAALLSLTALRDAPDDAMLEHCRAVAERIPLIGFYLQTAVGGQVLSREFWRRFLEIEDVVAIKVAPFDRYRTSDVVRALLESGREDVALLTGNDDHIVLDLLTPWRCRVDGVLRERHFDGGLLGQWAIGTKRAVELLAELRAARRESRIDRELIALDPRLTDLNAAVFDAAHSFRGCIPGILEVLRRQGLVPSARCLSRGEVLSPGQSAELDRVLEEHADLLDREFVAEHREEWLRD